jgi:hypothetical protein
MGVDAIIESLEARRARKDAGPGPRSVPLKRRPFPVTTGALAAVSTTGGHLRFRRADVLALYVGVKGTG